MGARRGHFPPGVRLGPSSPLLDTKGSLSQARRRASGSELEDEIRTCAQWYEARGLATIEKVGPEVAGYGRTLRYVARGPYDWVGTLKGGRALAFESKGVTGNVSYTHDPKLMKQLKRLRLVRDLGGLAFLMLVERRDQVLVLLGPQLIDPLLRGVSVTFGSRKQGRLVEFADAPHMIGQLCTGFERLRTQPLWPFLELAQRAGW